MHVWKGDPSSDSSTCNLIIVWKPGFSTCGTFSCPNIGIDGSPSTLAYSTEERWLKNKLFFWLKRLLSKNYQVLKKWLTFLWREHLFKHGYVQHLFSGGRRSLAKKCYIYIDHRVQNFGWSTPRTIEIPYNLHGNFPFMSRRLRYLFSPHIRVLYFHMYEIYKWMHVYTADRR